MTWESIRRMCLGVLLFQKGLYCLLLLKLLLVILFYDFTCSLVKIFITTYIIIIDEMAEQYFLGLINESLNAFAPRVMEVLHQIAVKRR